MLGGMLAGHDESGGETIEKDGRKYKLFYGMSSATAMKKHAGGVAEYRSVHISSRDATFPALARISAFLISVRIVRQFFPEHRSNLINSIKVFLF